MMMILLRASGTQEQYYTRCGRQNDRIHTRGNSFSFVSSTHTRTPFTQPTNKQILCAQFLSLFFVRHTPQITHSKSLSPTSYLIMFSTKFQYIRRYEQNKLSLLQKLYMATVLLVRRLYRFWASSLISRSSWSHACAIRTLTSAAACVQTECMHA